MSTTTLRFLQQENIRISKQNEVLEQTNLNLNRYLDTIQTLYWASQTMPLENEPLECLDRLFGQVAAVIGAEDGSMLRLDHRTDELVYVLIQGDLRDQLHGFRIKSDTGFAGWVLDQKKPLIVNHPNQDWRFSGSVDEKFNFFTRSIASVPMLRHDEVIGVIHLLNKQRHEFTEADVALMLILSQLAVTVFEELSVRAE